MSQTLSTHLEFSRTPWGRVTWHSSGLPARAPLYCQQALSADGEGLVLPLHPTGQGTSLPLPHPPCKHQAPSRKLTFSAVRFQTVTVCPIFSKLETMPLPMRPRPKNPILKERGSDQLWAGDIAGSFPKPQGRSARTRGHAFPLCHCLQVSLTEAGTSAPGSGRWLQGAGA